MNWDEQIRNIKIGTLFIFFGKSIAASLVWMILAYIAMLIPVALMFWAMSMFLPQLFKA